VARLVTIQAVAQEELTEAVTRDFLYTLRRMTSLSKFSCFHESSLAKFYASRDVVNFRRTTLRAAS